MDGDRGNSSHDFSGYSSTIFHGCFEVSAHVVFSPAATQGFQSLYTLIVTCYFLCLVWFGFDGGLVGVTRRDSGNQEANSVGMGHPLSSFSFLLFGDHHMGSPPRLL